MDQDSLLQQLRECQDKLLGYQNAADAASVGHWSWSLDGGMSWDGHMLTHFGVPREKAPRSLDDVLLILEEDSQEVMMEAFEQATESNVAISVWITPENTQKKLHLTGRPYFVPGSSGPMISGLCQATTETPEIKTLVVEEPQEDLANFASVASHDLREPLRMITSYLRLLQERSPEALDDRARRYIDYACEGADRMRRLIEDLLSYARMEKETIDPHPLALEDVLNETIDNLSTTIHEEKAQVTVDINEAPLVLGDNSSLIRLFQNLVGNAIKFHEEGKTPRVHISFEDGDNGSAPGCWVVAVKDHGIGIDQDHHNLIFSLFQRLNTRDEYEGSGIGLSVCKKIARRHGGDIHFESEKGRGSTFRVNLLKAPASSLEPSI